jgi:hypothetical protein
MPKRQAESLLEDPSMPATIMSWGVAGCVKCSSGRTFTTRATRRSNLVAEMIRRVNADLHVTTCFMVIDDHRFDLGRQFTVARDGCVDRAAEPM